MLQFNTEDFITKYITHRRSSLFEQDIQQNSDRLSDKIYDKDILVIGGAGTIGSSYIKAVLPFRPKSLTVVDYNENGLTELTRDLRSTADMFVPKKYITYPFDFGGEVFERLMDSQKFDIIACFAAHKHVRSEKDHLAIEAMIRNNIFNTYYLLEKVRQNPPEHLFAVSTDKAANPVNVMGATKKIMEHVLLAYSTDLNICTARFANVAFSNGSLLNGFIERMMKRQPLSSPSDIKRYFVSPIESGQLCMIASLLGQRGDIFFPKLGEEQMMSFSDIAELFLRSQGYDCDYCVTEDEAKKKAALWTPTMKKYPVYFFKTDTSGEKMYEEFYTEKDTLDLDTFHELGIIKSTVKLSKSHIEGIVTEFKSLFNSKIEKTDVIRLLSQYLPDFHHIETGKSLDQKM